MALSYHQATMLFAEQISAIGWRVVIDEISHQKACRLLKEATTKIFKGLDDENQMDVLHYYDAERVEELVESVIQAMNERLYSI